MKTGGALLWAPMKKELEFMKALLLTAPGTLAMTDVDTPPCGDFDVVVRVAACGICGSDIHGLDGSTGRRIPPLVMGHEAAGTVSQIGSQVRDIKKGARVALDSTIACGACNDCSSGRENLCMSRQVLGVSCGTYRRHGCFAEYVVVPQHAVYVIPDSLTFVQASLLEPLTIALHALRLGGSGAHTNSAVVVGCGTIGLTLISALAAKGCRAIAAIDIDASRLATAKKHGATIGFSGNDSDVAAGVVDWAKQHGSGDGADLVVEAVGTTAAVQIAIDSAARGATVVLVGNVSPRIEFALQTVVTRQLRILGSCSSAGCYPEAIELVASGRVDLDHLVSRVAPLSEGAEWFRRLVQREDGLVKVVLEP